MILDQHFSHGSRSTPMGNFYTNYTLKGVKQTAVARVLSGRKCIVTPSVHDTVVVFDEQSDDQNFEVISTLASQLSVKLRCPVLAIVNHDDDILFYQLHNNGQLEDDYDSTPGYFDPQAQPSSPVGGDPHKLCGAFRSGSVEEVDRVLRKPCFDANGYTFAFERHADLAKALGISTFGVGTTYASFEMNEVPEGLSVDDLIRTA
jgi:hypothetical protein